VSAAPAEVIGLTQSIAYAEHLAGEAGQHGPDGNEGYLARLAAAQVTGTGLMTGGDMQQAFAAAAAAAAAHAAELTKQLNVQEAYDATPDAGDKDYLTDNAGGGTPPDAGDEQETSTPVTDDDPDPELAAAAAYIAATTSSHPQRPPVGRDLQHRPAEGYEDDEQPWMSLPVRSTGVCQHVETVCRECLESWSWGHDLRVAEVPTSVDVEAHRGAADEFYTFEGDPERDLRPYWVARHGRTVTSQIAGDPVNTVLLGDDDVAAAEFAEGCCDNTPGAPGEVRAGDRIEVFGNHPGGERELTVTASTPAASGGYTVTGTDGEGRSVSVTVDAWQYKIARRPAGAAQ
jgi:hypothetical protein